jgi:hypothetical protein
MEIHKPKRHVDQDILEKYRRRPCDVCGLRGPSDPAHIGTRGAHYPDVDWNLYSGCRLHHTEQGQIGFYKMVQKYPFFGQLLAQKGWVFDGNKKLRRTSWDDRSPRPYGKL